MTHALAERIILFARNLRTLGLAVSPEEIAGMLDAATTVGLQDRDDVRSALRSVATRRREERPLFDAAFEAFFGGPPPVTQPPPKPAVSPRAGTIGMASWGRAPSSATGRGEAAEQVGASYGERLARRDFAQLDDDELEEVRRRLASLAWGPTEALSRRWEARTRGPRPDLRRSLRSWVGPAGDLMLPTWRERRRRLRPIIVIADVSGSMERYVDLFLSFIHAAKSRLGRLEAFVFSTRLTRITRELDRRDARIALAQVAEVVEDWSGGTRIGEALQTFNYTWSRRVTRGGPVCIVISDGWDCGDPRLLSREMGRLARSVHRVVWLTPRGGQAGYQPATRGMQAALPHVDDLLPAGSLDDMADLVRLLESIPARR